MQTESVVAADRPFRVENPELVARDDFALGGTL